MENLSRPRFLDWHSLTLEPPILVIDEQAAKELGLPVIDVANMQSATHENHPCNIYPIQIITPIITLNAPRAMGAALASQGLLVLIGRDVLEHCTLFYNGPVGQFTLSL